jgi:NAD(P)-dependent dehydrogenase (short-subunit alcohol dehydrogenase family)
VKKAVEHVIDEEGRIDILVNNAGALAAGAPHVRWIFVEEASVD